MRNNKYNIYLDENSRLVFESKKSRRFTDILFYFFVPAIFLGGPLIYALVVMSKGVFFRPVSVFLFVIFFLIVLTVIVYNIRRSLAKNKTYILSNSQDKIFINDALFCLEKDLEAIEIYEYVDGDGASSFNVGIASKQNFFPLRWDQDKIESREIAIILAKYFNRGIVEKNGKMLVP